VRPSTWSLWTMPRHVSVFILLTDLAAVSVTAGLVITHLPTGHDAVMAAVIIVLGMVNTEISRHIERMRRRFSDTPHVNLTSVWTMAAALILSPGLAAAVVIALYLHLWVRSWYQVSGVHAYRLTFSAATIVLACHAVAGVSRKIGVADFLTPTFPQSVWVVPLGILVFSAVNSVLIAVAIGMAERTTSALRTLGSWNENAIEYATLCLGVLTAALLNWNPLLVATFIPALHILHRSILVRQLEQAAIRDSKTGLLNAMAWHTFATKELEKAERNGDTLGVLMIDIDHFKLFNDQYGHLVGDRVLRDVAATVRREVRSDDCVGRFGGEEFVVALPNVDQEEATAVAERICAQVREIRAPDNEDGGSGISVSVGVAVYPAAGTGLDDVLLKADNAMYGAKDNGRNQVRAATFRAPPSKRQT